MDQPIPSSFPSETQNKGKRDRQPPHLHEVHLTRRKKGSGITWSSHLREDGGVAVDGPDRVEALFGLVWYASPYICLPFTVGPFPLLGNVFS
jgi:hypothetical protein